MGKQVHLRGVHAFYDLSFSISNSISLGLVLLDKLFMRMLLSDAICASHSNMLWPGTVLSNVLFIHLVASMPKALARWRVTLLFIEFANVFDARFYFPLCYTSLISVCDVIS